MGGGGIQSPSDTTQFTGTMPATTSGVAQTSEGRAGPVFDPVSLDIIYYPVSGIMWLWYKAFAAIPFLVFTLRAILYKPFVRQIRTTRQMQEMQPQIKALQKKYGKDRQRFALEMQKLQREHGVNPVLGCLPMLAQIPVFLGLYHVLMSFNRTQHGIGRLGLDPETNRRLGNYVFSAADVNHFLDANLFGAPIGASMTQSAGSIAAFHEFDRMSVIAIGLPLMLLAGFATHMNSRASIERQSVEAAANPQTAIMNRLALYVFPLGVVVGGPFLPLAIILYWFANNIWTFAQQHYVFGMIEKEDEAKRQEAVQRRAANAPAPGAKPKRNQRTASASGNGSSTRNDDDTDAGSVAGSDSDGSDDGAGGAKTATAQPEKPDAAGRTNGPTNRTPRPGARPKR